MREIATMAIEMWLQAFKVKACPREQKQAGDVYMRPWLSVFKHVFEAGRGAVEVKAN